MRVTLVTHYYPAHRGGVERIAGQLAARLAAAGSFQFRWHASDCDPAPEPKPGVTPIPARSCNLAERRLGFPYPLWSPGALRRLVRDCRDADVVHLHDCLYMANLVAYAAARLARRPVLVTQHIGEVQYRSRLLRGLQALAHRLLGAWVLGGADRVVFESETVRLQFGRFVRYRASPQLVQNGVDTKQFQPAPADQRRGLRARLGVDAQTPLLLFLGRFVEKKGLPVLHALSARFSAARWLFAGWGPLDPAAWHLPNVSVVRSPGEDDIAALYQAADLLVLPSVGEGFPLSVQEAMACGTPAMVGSETAAGCPQAEGLLLHEVTGGGDTEARWSERLERLLASRASLEAMRPQVAAFAREHWDWDRCVERYAMLLRDCSTEKQISNRLGKQRADKPER
jgi:glycosyltransferase involved in cell wall biosynthesis